MHVPNSLSIKLNIFIRAFELFNRVKKKAPFTPVLPYPLCGSFQMGCVPSSKQPPSPPPSLLTRLPLPCRPGFLFPALVTLHTGPSRPCEGPALCHPFCARGFGASRSRGPGTSLSLSLTRFGHCSGLLFPYLLFFLSLLCQKR